MTARFIVGRSGYGKTERILNEIVEIVEQDKAERVLFIVPEQFTFQMEKELATRFKSGGMLKAEVVSFTRLAQKILKETGGLANVKINNEGKNMVLRKIINKNKEKLQIYKTVSGKEGFIQKISAAISEFKRAGILPHMIPVGSENLLSRKLQDIAIIYKLFNEYLEEKYIDTDDFINLFIQKAEKSTLIKESIIYIDSFSNFNIQEYRLIDRLVRYAKECVFSLTLDMEIYKGNKNNETGVFNATEKTYGKLCNIVEENGFPIVTEEIKNDGSLRDKEIKYLEKFLFMKKDIEPMVSNGRVKIRRYNNISDEIESSVQEIQDFAREKGYRWREIVIICNNINEYGGELKRALDVRNIPYFIDENRAVTSNRAVDYMVSILKCVLYNYEYEAMFRYLKSGFADVPYDDVETLENYVLKYNIKGFRWKSDFIYGDEETTRKINAIREIAIAPLLWIENEMKTDQTALEFAGKYYEFLLFNNMHQKLVNWAEKLEEKEALLYKAEVEQIWDITIDILDQIAEILNDDKMTIEEFTSVIETGFASCEAGNIPATMDQVIIGNMQRMRNYNIRAIFVFGATDGVIPLDRKNNGLLSDEEKEIIKAFGIDIGYEKWIVEDEERFGIYSNLTKSKEYLFVSWPSSTSEGEEIKPSEIIEQILSKFKDMNIEKGLSAYENIHDKTSLKYNLIYNINRAMNNKLESEDDLKKLGSLYKYLKEIGEADIFERLKKPENQNLSPEIALELWGKNITTSISRLETFSACQFMHFIKYGLKAQEREKFEIGNAEIGEFMHQVVETYEKHIEALPDKWEGLIIEECIKKAEEIADNLSETFMNGIFQSDDTLKGLFQRLKRVTAKFVKILTENIMRGKFRPVGYEICFGTQRDIPALKFPLENGNLYIEGRIDRADVYHDAENDKKYVLIIDYKSGAKDLKPAEVYNGLQMQLLVYLSLTKDFYGAMPAGAYYFRIEDYMINSADDDFEEKIREKYKMTGITLRNTDVVRAVDNDLDGKSNIIPVKIKEGMVEESNSVYSKDEMDKITEFVKQKVCKTAEAIVAGKIAINPYTFSNRTPCQYCLYKEICRFDFKNDRFRYIRDIKKEEFIGLIQ